MPIPTASFLLGLLVLGYLSTFVVFAVLRIVTGISIQRVGYSGFRHIAFTLRNGVRVNVRGIGISIHRPTFALPTWCSLVITELYVKVDLKALGENTGKANGLFEKAAGGSFSASHSRSASRDADEDGEAHGKLWRKLTDIKEKIKKLHSKIHWIKKVDLVVTSITLDVTGVGTVQVERVLLNVDTRSKTVDRSRLFQHHNTKADGQTPAEWRLLVRSLLLTPEGRDSTEVLDYATISIHGMLSNKLQGLRDASIALKLGRVNVPHDDVLHAKKSAELLRGTYGQPQGESTSSSVSVVEALETLDDPESKDDRIVQKVSDSRAFVASILRGIQEVQFAAGFFGLSRKLEVKTESGRDIWFNLAMKEVGLDVLRLDQKSPAHRMYFSSKDVAHQALLTAISISAGIDDGHEHPERMVYIPMITATVRTTLPSRTIHHTIDTDARERNRNMLYANFVCTSPSVDLDPKHLPFVQELLNQQGANQSTKGHNAATRHRLISQLLPKAYVKLSVQEPVIRISLPPMDKANAAEDEYDLLISSVTSVSIELESSHAAEEADHYNLGLHYRHVRHHLYYQTFAGDVHDLLHSDTVEVQVDVNAIPDPSVTVNAKFQTFTIFLTRPDICEGVRQIVKQLRKNVIARLDTTPKVRPSFLRTTPAWLEHVHIDGADFGLEIAGVDDKISTDTRGFALQLETWSTEYKAQRDGPRERLARRHSLSRAKPLTEKSSRSSSPHRGRPQTHADGRRLTVHFQSLVGLILDSAHAAEPESFISVPRFEIACSTTTDNHGPVFHINSHARNVLVQYSLYYHFAMGVAAMVIRKTFLDHEKEAPRRGSKTPTRPKTLKVPSELATDEDIALHEVTTIDFKSDLVQLKARMPADPPMMIQIFGLDAGRHRFGAPFARSRLARMYVRTPQIQQSWSRVVSIKTFRLDVREMKRKVHNEYFGMNSIDIVLDAIRFSVPHGLIVHDIFDNIANIIKVNKQLLHHFKTGTNEYILNKEPEGPKHVPRITLRTQMCVLDLEDSAFEWKLNAIYRSGLLEQKQRSAREDAFRLKEKRLQRGKARGRSNLRARSAQTDERRSRSKSREPPSDGPRKSRSTQPASRWSPQQKGRRSHRNMRYDADGQCGISDTGHLSIDDARNKLHRLNAQSWRNRIHRVMNFQADAIREIRTLLWGIDEIADDTDQQEQIVALGQRPALLLAALSDLTITIDKPSFPLNDYPKFLHDAGKGMPEDMKYSLLIPMNLHITAGEARFQLRDYPLPLIHVPSLAGGQSLRNPSLTLRTDFVIAEEFRDRESQRHVSVEIVPAKLMSTKKAFTIDVIRTISPVKTYSNMKFEVNTSNPTRITWGTSYQPAIQDAMQVIEGFTKPPVDPSDRVGFWDKIRLSFHSRVNVAWKGDGDVHLVLKGSRDPYVVTGQGAGFVMVWRNDVRWDIAQSDDPRQFMTVDSSDYILAIPDFNSYALRAQQEDANDDDGSTTSSSSHKKDAMFKKVVMKLSGKVRWVGGLVLERDTADGRSFDFKPHYDVVLKHPDYAKAPPGGTYDAYTGFRSHHIHMSITISAPHDRDWNVANHQPANNYNAIHLTPRFFSHFFSWWSMFSGVMSLPIRQGPLWGVTEKQSKKLGRHLATLKYNLLLSPLYISHVYKHKEAEDYQESSVSATGLKARLDSFMLDLHQRREYFDIQGREGASSKKSSGMRINQAQVDFMQADLRALSASITGTSSEDIEKANDETLADLHSQTPVVDMSKFTIPDNDLTWIDMDDFVELDWTLPAESDPETKILPLAYAPRFTYFRNTDCGGVIAGDPTRTSPFGDEPTHHCVMSAKNDPRRVQVELIEKRLAKLRDQTSENKRAAGQQELEFVKCVESDTMSRDKHNQTLETLHQQSEHLRRKSEFLETVLQTLYQRLEEDDPSAVPDLETSQAFFESHENARGGTEDQHAEEAAPLADYNSDFSNRFIVHNAQIKWNNSLRNIILRYIHQNSQRRGFVYYMSRRAVKFILDIIDEQRKNDDSGTSRKSSAYVSDQGMLTPDGVDDDAAVQERIDQLLRDGRDFVEADDPPIDTEEKTNEHDGPNADVGPDFTTLNSYQFRLIAPQVQLQSEQNPKAAVLVTSKGMQLKVVQIMDRNMVGDDVSGLVQRRFTAAADSLQMFVTTTSTFSTEHLHMYSANRYGTKAGTYWPPWVPMEMMVEFHENPYGFSRVVHRTSASLRYDKYNALRLKYNDDVSGGDASSVDQSEEAENRMDRIWVDFPQFRAICDSSQYYAMYMLARDLLLYSEPLEKTRSERLEKIMLASDFSDLSGAPHMVFKLQERIRQLEEIKMHFQVNEKFLDRQGWKDRIAIDADLASCEDELFFMMKAITTAQQRNDDRREHEDVTGMVRLNMTANEIAWHLTREENESLMEFQLEKASFDRTHNNDGSNYNSVEIGRVNGFNLLPNAIYPEIIAAYVNEARGFPDQRNGSMLRVHWLMLEAIAGIPVVDYFEADLVPLKLQIERDVAKKLFEYVFPGIGGNAFEGSGLSNSVARRVLPQQEDGDQSGERTSDEQVAIKEDPTPVQPPKGDSHGLAALEQRLRPTLHLAKNKKKSDSKGLGISTSNSGGSGFSIFQQSDRSKTSLASNKASGSQRGASSANNGNGTSGLRRQPSERSMRSTNEKEKHKRFTLHRRDSADTTHTNATSANSNTNSNTNKSKDKSKDGDDLSQMLDRASNYMTLAFVKIPSMVLCLSYKGHGRRNIEDVHDFVFRMPTIEYRNKTWSHLDLAMALKKDFVKALAKHAGAIVGNKFSHHRPSRSQQSRLREVANMSSLMGPSAIKARARAHLLAESEASSLRRESLEDHADEEEDESRRSGASDRRSSLTRTLSNTSSASVLSAYETAGNGGVVNGDGTAKSRSSSVPRPGSSGGNGDDSRPRATSISRHFTGLGERLRPSKTNDSGANNGEVGEESSAKSKLLLGGQKLLGKLRD